MKPWSKSSNLTIAVGSVRAKSHTVLQINVPQKRVYNFVTRQTLLAEITNRLFSDHSAETVVLLGMGGAGKTQLALEACRQAEENGRFGAVFWVDASSPKSVIQSYKVIAQKILKNQSYMSDAEDAIRLQVQDALREWDRKWLMVFDNYDNPQAFQDHSIRNYVPGGKSGRILFTSRHRDSTRLGHKVDASTMTENESLKLLLQRLPLHEDELIYGRKVVSTLGYLALALDQAGAYIRARSLDLKEFIQHYHDRKEVVLQEIPDQWEYSRAVDDEEREIRLRIFTTWELSFKQISGQKAEVQDKEHFLTLAAFFDAGNISERYFQAYFNKSNPEWMKIFSSNARWDSYKLRDVLSEFQKLSLLQTRKPTHMGQSISIHPVIADWIKLRKSPSVQHSFATELTTALTAYLKDTDTGSLSLEIKQETVRHIDSCILSDKTLSPLSGQILDTLPQTLSLFADFYSDHGRYSDEECLLRRALAENKEKLGATNRATLNNMEKLASSYSNLSRYDEAESLYKQTLFEMERKLGKMHRDTLITVANVAVNCFRQERYDEAEEFLERALRGFEDTLGLTQPNVLRLASSLAVVYENKGRYDEAEKLQERALRGFEDTLGLTQPNVLRLASSLAVVYENKGRYDEAEKLQERALIGLEKYLGVKHRNTLATVENLGNVYSDQGRYDEAETLYKRALLGHEEMFGEAHPKTLRTMFNLALNYYRRGRYDDEAKELFERALAGYIASFGARHRDTLKTVEFLARTYRRLGQREEAEELEKRYPST